MTENEEQSKANRNADAARTAASAITSLTPSQREHLRALSDPHPNAAELAAGVARAQASFGARHQDSERPKLSDTITQSVNDGVVGALQEALLPALATYVERLEVAAARIEAAAERIEAATQSEVKR